MRLRVNNSSSGLLICVGLLLVIWLTRLIGIALFPPFIDEMIHIHGSEQGYTISPLMNAGLGRQGTIWWMMLFQAHLGSPVWIARVATVLALLPGIAALMATARLMIGYWGAALAGLLFLFSNYHMFFGRLALADPIAGSAVLVVIYFAARLGRRRNLWDALLVGIMLAVGVAAKINVAPFLGVPIAAAVCLHAGGKINIRRQAVWLAVALGTALLLITAFVIALRLFGYDFLTNSVSYALTNRGAASIDNTTNVDRFTGSILLSYELLSAYLGIAVLVALLVAQVVLVLRRQFYLVFCLFGPLLAIWASLIQESRFLVVPVALLLLGGAVVLAQLIHHRNRLLQVATIVIVGLWGVVQWLPFATAGVNQPNQLPLPAVDVAQYITSDAAGTGYPEAAAFLSTYNVGEVIGLVSNCQAFRYLTMSRYRVDCPSLNPNGSSIPALTDLVNQKRGDNIFVLLQAIPYVPQTVPGKLLTVIERPGNGPKISIYQLSGG